jgi:replicative DNA helicase
VSVQAAAPAGRSDNERQPQSAQLPGVPEFDRTPPQDVAAEQSVLGGMLLSKDAIADVIEILRDNDFYRPAHAIIFEIVLDLYGRGEPADPITVSAALTESGELTRIGGVGYLHTLISSVPTAANAGYYARIVAERAVLRRLIEAGTRIAQLGYSGTVGTGRDVDDVVDLAQQAVYEVTERRTSDDYTVLEELLQPAMDEIEAIGAHGDVMSGVPTGFVDLDRLTNGFHPGQLIIVAGRPGLGKSTAGLDWVRSCSVRNHLTSVIFSLEMSKIEIVMRLLSAEARVPLHALRSGQLSEDDWTKLARQMGEISEAPLYIDDSPNMNLMEIRAKARRLKQRHDLRFILVDYLQLMSSPKRTESRQQEVSELSRGLKLMAKELEVPVIAVSQLNRGPEQRTDKRPQLSDLRESGCLPAGTRVMRADTGAEITIGELMASGQKNIPVWALDSSLRYVPRTMTHAFSSGVKETYRLRLASGREVLATANHPFLSHQGWRALGDLAPGMRVGVPRHVPAPLRTQAWAEPELLMLAHLIGDGTFLRGQPIRYASIDAANRAVVTAAARHFGSTAVTDDYPAARRVTIRLTAADRLSRGLPNPVASWLDQLGLLGARSDRKFLPDSMFSLPKAQVAVFLQHLWATDGCVWWDDRTDRASIYFGTPSRRLADDVARLLMRYGVRTSIRRAMVKPIAKPGYRDNYHVVIGDPDDQLRFLRGIGVFGARSAEADRCRQDLEARAAAANPNTGPAQVWDRVRGVLADERTGGTDTKIRRAVWTHGPSRERLREVAAALDDAGLEMLATNDIYWDEIVSITSVGDQPVFDATVLGGHNFIADGVAVHNSIEQDADMVILLHRDDYYEKESPRAGEADFIVAKHRNGPTDTITVAFQGHFSRFVDMSTGG